MTKSEDMSATPTAPDHRGVPPRVRRPEDLPEAARRALAEAEARRREIDARQQAMAPEIDGRGGLEPTRYRDWEVKGIACDF